MTDTHTEPELQANRINCVVCHGTIVGGGSPYICGNCGGTGIPEHRAVASPCATATEPTCIRGCPECAQAPISVAQLDRLTACLANHANAVHIVRKEVARVH